MFIKKRDLILYRSFYKFVSEVDSVIMWIDEKDQLLKSVVIPNNMEEMNLVQHRFEGRREVVGDGLYKKVLKSATC